MKRLIVLAAAAFLSSGAALAAAPHWIGTWGAPPAVTLAGAAKAESVVW